MMSNFYFFFVYIFYLYWQELASNFVYSMTSCVYRSYALSYGQRFIDKCSNSAVVVVSYGCLAG